MKKILQVNFKFKVPRAELEKGFMETAKAISPKDVKGFHWKIWLMNEAEKTAGGIYLFEDGASVEAFLNGLFAEAKKGMGEAVSDWSVKVFDIVLEPTRITRGPVG